MPAVSIISRIRRYSSHVFFAVLSFFFQGGEFGTGLKLVEVLNRDIQARPTSQAMQFHIYHVCQLIDALTVLCVHKGLTLYFVLCGWIDDRRA